jgi:hypothetical protein
MMAVLTTLAFFAQQKGVFETVIENDASYISLVCMTLFVGFSAYTGKLAYDADKKLSPSTVEQFHRKMEPAWFAAEHFLTLGLIGTTAGFCYTVNKALGVSGTEVTEIITQLKNGIGRTLYTTIAGLVCSLLLQVQLFVVQYKVKSVEKHEKLPKS